LPEQDRLHQLRFDEAESAPVRQVRSTVLMSSLAAARARGKFDAYLKGISNEHRSIVLSLTPGDWVPIAVAEAHYAALDRCGFSTAEMVAIGEEVPARLDGTSLGSVISVAKEIGATPWMALAACPRIFERTFVGGGIAVFKDGPKDARVEVRGVPIVRFTYFREAWRGVFQGALKRLSLRMFVHELASVRTDSRWALHIQWA
jgi:hypothetical protein